MASVVGIPGSAVRAGREKMLSAFDEPIRPGRASVLYSFGLLVVAVAMVLLPIIYLGLIAAVGYGLYYHATHDAAVIFHGHSGGMKGRVVAYVGPLIIGGVLILFMIKPLFSRFTQDDRRVSLTPKGEPFLYEFVRALCRCIGAPLPKRIDVNMSANASASLRRGLLSFLGSDLVLTIGLPLAAGMTARELAGVMAHEFGHFTQGLAMRLTYVIRSINAWFARVVYERDTWDEQLASWAHESGGSARLIAYLAMLCVWLTRRTLWVLMMVGHAISCFMLRQMEYNADAYEIHVGGSESFARAFEKLMLLELAGGRAQVEVGEMYQERRLPDNLPLYTHSVLGRMPQGLVEAVRQQMQEGKTGLLDTHPATSKRIARARRMDVPGIFTAERPAAELFADFEQLSREVTRISYGWMQGSKLDRVKLVPLAAAKSEQETAERDNASFKRYLQGLWQVDRPLGLRMDDLKMPLDTGEAVDRLKRTRGKIEAALPQARALYEKYEQAREETTMAVRARALLKAGIPIDAASFHLDAPTMEAAGGLEARSRQTAEKLRAKLAPFDAAQCKRLLTALGLLSLPEVGGKIRDADTLLHECETYVMALVRLDAVLDRMRDLHEYGTGIDAVAGALADGREAKQPAIASIRDLSQQVHNALAELRAQLDDSPYPFEHAEEGISIGVWAVDVPPFDDDLKRLMPAAGQALNRLMSLYFRLIARLAAVAESVESAVGLAPLPEPSAAKQPEK